jgi:hypothetical protein
LVAKRGGRTRVISPDGVASVAPTRARLNNTMAKALARAFRRRKLETGVFATVDEITTAETINVSYVRRVLPGSAGPRLIESILRQPSAMMLAVLMRPLAGGAADLLPRGQFS